MAAAGRLDRFFGYGIVNDISARDQRRSGQWFFSKGQDTYAPFGPLLVTAAELGDPHDVNLRLRVNGQTKQESNTRHMLFRIPRLIEDVSVWGDAGARRRDRHPARARAGVELGMVPQQFLQPGDTVEAEIDGIGMLRNFVVDATRRRRRHRRGGRRVVSALRMGRSCPAPTPRWRPGCPGPAPCPRRGRAGQVHLPFQPHADEEGDRRAGADGRRLQPLRDELSDRVDVLAYACLVAIMSMGHGYHRESSRRLHEVTAEAGARYGGDDGRGYALVEGLAALGAADRGDHPPYMKPLTEMVVGYIEQGSRGC